jgi:hypothetical protein
VCKDVGSVSQTQDSHVLGAEIPGNSQLQVASAGVRMAQTEWILGKNPRESQQLSPVIPAHSHTFASMLTWCETPGKPGIYSQRELCRLRVHFGQTTNLITNECKYIHKMHIIHSFPNILCMCLTEFVLLFYYSKYCRRDI